MEMPFDEPPMAEPAWVGVGSDGAAVGEIIITEVETPTATRVRRHPIWGMVMALMEAWPTTGGPFFTTDGQSATYDAQVFAEP